MPGTPAALSPPPEPGLDDEQPVFGWRRQVLVLAAVLGCLTVFALARWLATTPHLDGEWIAGDNGSLQLRIDDAQTLQVAAIGAPGLAPQPVDALLLHRSPRWQVVDAERLRQVQQHEALATLLARPGGVLQLHGPDGRITERAVSPRGYAGLGWAFWPLSGLALLIYLFAVVLMLARPQPRKLLFLVMALCQAGNLVYIALEGARGLGLPIGALACDLPVRATLDIASTAAAVHAFILLTRTPHWQALLAWGLVPAWWLAAAVGGLPLWWLAQAACLGLGAWAVAVAHVGQRRQANAHALVLRRLASAAWLTLALVTVAVAGASGPGQASATIAAAASATWYLFVASLLLLTPFLARRRQVLREFSLLAGVSTVVTSLDLLFAAVFSLSDFASLAVAVFVGVGLYAAARQWVLQHLVGTSMLTTERTFEHLYRAARELQAQPRSHPQLLARLMRELFEPLEVQVVDRVPVRSRLLGGGSALAVPLRPADDDAPGSGQPLQGLVLRHARRGQRLFTLEDARLADRVVEQLRRAVAYDAAVERGRAEERQRIAQDLHDDIGARLLTLMYQAQSREMEDYIRHTLQDLKTLTRGLAATEHRLSHAAAEWKADLTQRLSVAQASLGWHLQVDHDRPLTVVQWSALTRVLRELVSNALFHGHATHVEVSLQLEGPVLRLQVADDGVGRGPEGWAHGLGLGGVRKRVKLLGGEVAWSENGERGIVCTVRVPEFASPA